MILKHHIDLLRHLNKEDGVNTFLNNFKAKERIRIMRELNESYPLDIPETVSQSLYEDFNVCLDVNELVLGQFIMLEQIITGKTRLEEWQIDVEILKLILRPKHHKDFDNENTEDESNNEYKILHTETSDLYSALNKFLENRNKTLFKDFAGVFYDLPDEEDEEEENQEKDSTSEMLFKNQWYWYSIVRMLAQEDIRRYNEIYMLPMSTVLPEMSYLAQKNKIEDADRRQQQALRKL